MPGMLRRITSLILWSCLVILSSLGVVAIVFRGLAVTDMLATGEQKRSALSERDRRNLNQLAALAKVEPASKRYHEAEEDIGWFNARFVKHPVYTFLHLFPGLLFMILAPIQFSSHVRTRYIRFHRWSGRVLLCSAIPLGVSAFFFGLLMPFGGASESIAIVTFATLFLFTAVRAFLAIRRGNVARHREWMIRMFSIAIGVSTVRIVDLALAFIVRNRPRDLFAPALWIGWLLTFTVAETWVRYTLRRSNIQANSLEPVKPSIVHSVSP